MSANDVSGLLDFQIFLGLGGMPQEKNSCLSCRILKAAQEKNPTSTPAFDGKRNTKHNPLATSTLRALKEIRFWGHGLPSVSDERYFWLQSTGHEIYHHSMFHCWLNSGLLQDSSTEGKWNWSPGCPEAEVGFLFLLTLLGGSEGHAPLQKFWNLEHQRHHFLGFRLRFRQCKCEPVKEGAWTNP